MCKLKDLQNGTYSIDDVADMHEGLDMKEAAGQIIAARTPTQD